MFDYPLIFSRHTLYTKLGISPVATSEDINDAKGEIIRSLNLRSREIEQRLSVIFKKVPNLQSDKERLKSLQNPIEGQNQEEYQKIVISIGKFEKEAEKVDPDYKKLEAEKEQIAKKINEFTLINLEKSEEQRKYDLITPPCALLKLEQYRLAVIANRRTTLFHVRNELARHFEEELDMECYHPSDFTRRIFISDFEHNHILDEEGY